MYLANGSGSDRRSFSYLIFLCISLKLILRRSEYLKSLLVYASDECEGLEKKTKVSALMNARHALVTLEPSRSQYSVNSEHVQDSSTKIFCLCLVTHMVSA